MKVSSGWVPTEIEVATALHNRAHRGRLCLCIFVLMLYACHIVTPSSQYQFGHASLAASAVLLTQASVLLQHWSHGENLQGLEGVWCLTTDELVGLRAWFQWSSLHGNDTSHFTKCNRPRRALFFAGCLRSYMLQNKCLTPSHCVFNLPPCCSLKVT